MSIPLHKHSIWALAFLLLSMPFMGGSNCNGARNPFAAAFNSLKASQEESDRALRAAIERFKPPEGNPFAASEAAEEKKRAEERVQREERQRQEAPRIVERLQAQRQRLAQLQEEFANARLRAQEEDQRWQANAQRRQQAEKAEKREARKERRRHDRSAGYSRDDLERYERSITADIFESDSVEVSTRAIGALYKGIEADVYENGRKQAVALRKRFLNDEGLVKDWVGNSIVAQGLHFSMPEDDINGIQLRIQANTALKVHELNYASVEEARVRDAQLAEQALLILSQADKNYAAALAKDADTERNRELARRYFQRAVRLLRSFTPSDPLYSPGFRPMDTGIYVEFDLQDLDNRGFRQLEILVAAHLLHRDSQISQAILDDEALRFHTATAFYEAKEAAKADDVSGLYTQLDFFYSILDNMNNRRSCTALSANKSSSNCSGNLSYLGI